MRVWNYEGKLWQIDADRLEDDPKTDDVVVADPEMKPYFLGPFDDQTPAFILKAFILKEVDTEVFRFTNLDLQLESSSGSVWAISCQVYWDTDRECWHAISPEGFHGTSERKPRAALACFMAWTVGDQSWFVSEETEL